MRLRALERIQEVVFPRFGLQPGSYGAYALRVENLFLPNPLIALDEYGIPPELDASFATTSKPMATLTWSLSVWRRSTRGGGT